MELMKLKLRSDEDTSLGFAVDWQGTFMGGGYRL